LARRGEVHMDAFFSPRASANPHHAEMCEDVRDLFYRIVERSKQ
jgi:hypothetical protein